MSEVTTKDAVIAAMNGDAKGFQDAISDVMIDKVRDAIDLKKLEVSASFMSPDSEEIEDTQGEPDGDQEV